MQKKILIGCIGAVVILLVTSFSSVVGTQKGQSDIVNDSPLFHVKTQRANGVINNDIITKDYISKGKFFTIPLPILNDKQNLFKNILERINQMNDAEFEKTINKIIKEVREKNIITEQQIPELVKCLNEIRENADILMSYQIYKIKDDRPYIPSLTAPCTWFEVFIPWCIIWSLVLLTLPIWLPLVIIATVLLLCI